jgi:hypothetical protein
MGSSTGVSIFLGIGNGTFPSRVDYPGGINPQSITTGDFNSDGKIDIAVATWSGASVILGVGDGTFGVRTSYSVSGSSVRALAMGDFNSDGKLDLAVTSQTANTVSVLLNNTPSSTKGITAFTIPSQIGTTTINETTHTIGITMPYGTNVTGLVPAITITGAAVNPLSGVSLDFTSPQTYIVTAADTTTQGYTVTITVALNPAKEITGFTIPSQTGPTIINETTHTIAITMPYETVVTALVPTITITGESVNPSNEVANDFTAPQTYIVTAADATSQLYTVTVIVTSLDDLKVAAKAEVASALAGYDEIDYTSYDWESLNLFHTTGDEEIDAATNLIDIILAKDTAIDGMYAVETITQTLSYAKAAESLLISSEYVDYSLVIAALALPETNSSEMLAKTVAINNAISGLVLKADLAAYNSALGAVIEGDYTIASWAIYQEVVLANFVTVANTQAQVNIALENILNAQNALVTIVDANLFSAKLSVVSLTPSRYSNYGMLSNALALPETTIPEKIAKTIAIKNAVAGLVIKPVMTIPLYMTSNNQQIDLNVENLNENPIETSTDNVTLNKLDEVKEELPQTGEIAINACKDFTKAEDIASCNKCYKDCPDCSYTSIGCVMTTNNNIGLYILVCGGSILLAIILIPIFKKRKGKANDEH